MANHRVICIIEEAVIRPSRHNHIVAVGTGLHPDYIDRRWTVTDLLSALDRGEVFYTQGVASGKVAAVEKTACPHCGEPTLRSATGAVADNELSSLRHCREESERDLPSPK